MALINPIASAPESEVRALRRDPDHVVVASLIGKVSSFNMGGWTDPFGVLLQEVFLKGELVDARQQGAGPRFHDRAPVKELRRRMDEAVRTVAAPRPDEYDEWARTEFEEAHRIVVQAADHGECVVSGWEIFDPSQGHALRIRLRNAEDGRLKLPLPVSIGSAVFGLGVGVLIWRKVRMDRRREI